MDKPPHALQQNGIVYVGDAWHPMTPFAGKQFLRSSLMREAHCDICKQDIEPFGSERSHDKIEKASCGDLDILVCNTALLGLRLGQ